MSLSTWVGFPGSKHENALHFKPLSRNVRTSAIVDYGHVSYYGTSPGHSSALKYDSDTANVGPPPGL